MVAAFLFLTTVISAAGWLLCWIAANAVVWYMADKGYAPPSDEEAKAYCARVLKKMLHIH